MRKKVVKTLCGAVLTLVAVSIFGGDSYADVGISLTPMNQKIILEEGEKYCGDFSIHNGVTNTEDLRYKISVDPFYVDDGYNIYYDNNGDYNKIVDWTTLSVASGEISPNETQSVEFCVDVPEGAPAGGQYMAIRVISDNSGGDIEGAVNIGVSYGMAHIVYTEIAGTTEREGEIADLSVPGFLFSGNINASSVVKNTGNVHGNAKYTLQVFPLFSDEEVYTNEENPESATILPDRSYSKTLYWNDTKLGIYNIVYKVEFEGVTKQLKKMVIVCPVWLLIIIFAAIMLALFKLFTRKKD